MRTNTGLTLYNRYIDDGAEEYQRTQIEAVAWENRKGANVLRTGGDLAADQAAIYIPFAQGEGYVGPKAWQALETKTGAWTLQVGDFVVKGLISDEIGAEFTMSDLKAKYDDVLRITSVDTMDLGSVAMRHWKVGAK